MITLSTVVFAPAPSQAHEGHTFEGEFGITDVFTGLDQPTVVAFSSDGKIFIGEKSGTIKVFDGPDDSDGPDVIDVLPPQVHDYIDRGLLGLAVHPEFNTGSPYLYTFYTWDHKIPAQGAGSWGDTCPLGDDPGCVVDGRLSRFPIGPNNLPSGPEQVLIEDRWCQRGPGHSIGTLAFGPNGALYASAGEGASALTEDFGQIGGGLCGDPTNEGGAVRSQDLMSSGDPVGFNGTVLRLDPETGAALPDNPLVGNGVPDDDEIIAFGMRNPYRFTIRPGSYDQATGAGPEIYVSDTGWWRWEELNLIEDAQDAIVENFGWPCYAGDEFDTSNPSFNRQPNYDGENLPLCEDQYSGVSTSNLRLPLMAYEHGTEIVPGDGCLTGGSAAAALSFYEGGRYPDHFDGALFFSDYSRQCMWVMYEDGSGAIDPDSIELFMDGIGLIVDLKAGPGGDLFYVSFGEWDINTNSIAPNSGALKQLDFFPDNQPPTAQIELDPHYGPIPLEVFFDGSGSSDPDDDPLTYAWDLDGDGSFDDAAGPKPFTSYFSVDVITVGLEVSDGEFVDQAFATISPGLEPPTASIDTFPTAWETGELITLQGSATDPIDGPLSGSALEWDILLQHCDAVDSCHTHSVTSFSGDEVTLPGPEHEYPSFLQARLTATNSAGLADSVVVDLMPATVEITLDSFPSGLMLRAFNQELVTPFTVTTIKGSPLSISAPSPQSPNGFSHEFVYWSDGGAPSHDIVPTADTTVTAYFTHDLLSPPTWPNSSVEVIRYRDTSLEIEWSEAVDEIEVITYIVYRDGLPIASTPTTSLVLSGLAPGTEYDLAVQAVDPQLNVSSNGPAILASTKDSPVPGGVGIVQSNGRWNLRDADGDERSFFFGQAGDYPFMGDWDCDGVDTPGLYRQTDGLVYLSNTNSLTNADIEFIFGIPGDIPIAGDFDGDGCDTVSVYRNGHVFIINQLGADGGALFADFDYFFGNPGDTPFTGDFDNDGIDELGLYRETTGLVYFALAHPPGGAIVADDQFFFGQNGDRIVAEDWTNDGTGTVGIFRSSNSTFYLSYVNELRFADEEIVVPWSGFPVAGQFDF